MYNYLSRSSVGVLSVICFVRPVTLGVFFCMVLSNLVCIFELEIELGLAFKICHWLMGVDLSFDGDDM